MNPIPTSNVLIRFVRTLLNKHVWMSTIILALVQEHDYSQ